MKIVLTIMAVLMFGLSFAGFAQSSKNAYIGKWSNGRGEPLMITADTIQYGKDKPLKYKDVTKASDGAYFNLEITEPGKHNYFTNFLSVSFNSPEKSDEMKIVLFDSYQDMFNGQNPQGENNWFQEKESKNTPDSVKVFLVAVSDNGKTGKKIGCDDSLIAVNRTVESNGAPLKSAIEALLATPRDYNEKLGNFWGGNNLKIKSISVKKGIAAIYLTGDGPPVAGICDEPRIISQIEETAKQFSTVKRVKVFINNEDLAEVIK